MCWCGQLKVTQQQVRFLCSYSGFVGVDLLRTKWRIVGNFVGALPQKPMQNLQLALPLLLLPEEVSLLLHKGGS